RRDRRRPERRAGTRPPPGTPSCHCDPPPPPPCRLLSDTRTRADIIRRQLGPLPTPLESPPASLKMTSPVFVAALLAAAVLGFVALAERSVGFQDVEFWAYDFLINHGGYAPASRSIVI